MGKTQLTLDIETALYKKEQSSRGIMGCFEVTIGWYGSERVDYLTMDFDGMFRCYEIKVTKADFYSKAHATFCGDFNYYVLPTELYEQVKHDIPAHVGVYVYEKPSLRWKYGLRCEKKAQRQGVNEEARNALYQSLIRSLCRERDKFKRAMEEQT